MKILQGGSDNTVIYFELFENRDKIATIFWTHHEKATRGKCPPDRPA